MLYISKRFGFFYIKYGVACEDIFTHSGSLTKLLTECESQREGFAKKLYESVKAFIEKLITFFKELSPLYDSESYEAKTFRYSADKMKKLSELWESAFRAGMDNAGVVYDTKIESNYKLNQNFSDRESDDTFKSAKINSDLIKLIQKVKSGNFTPNEKVYLQSPSSSVANKILAITGIDVTNYRVAIEARQIEHIIKKHGEHGASDQTMSNDNTIAKLEYALQNPDELTLAGKTKAYSYMKNGRNRTADTVAYEKKVGNKALYVIQAVPDAKAQTLYIVTAFIGQKKETSQLIDAKAPMFTPENGSVVVSDNSISQNAENVNTLPENSKKYFSDREYHINSDREGLAVVFKQRIIRKYIFKLYSTQETSYTPSSHRNWVRGVLFHHQALLCF